MLVVIC